MILDTPTKKPEEEEPEMTEEEKFKTFILFSAEGDLMAKKGNYAAAIPLYTQALSIRPNDRTCLVNRSKCHQMQGDLDAALRDVDLALAQSPDYMKGLMQKAETLFLKGDFENALVWYHRGQKLYPSSAEFESGIQKTTEVIRNAIGDPDTFNKKASTQGDGKLSAMEERLILGEIYDDRLYLEEFAKDTTFETRPFPEVQKLISEGLKYLDQRMDFWKQESPAYLLELRKTKGHRSSGLSDRSNSALSVGSSTSNNSSKEERIPRRQSRPSGTITRTKVKDSALKPVRVA